uniref:LRAT domain-containing protein n=1 Tax=Ornithorhynchus anatinus TaxID=9258 RepID=A0A6I8PJU9_ORNAN
PTLPNPIPPPGDLIEIFQHGFEHWTLYEGDRKVIHLAPPGNVSQRDLLKARALSTEPHYRVRNKYNEEFQPQLWSIIRENIDTVLEQETECSRISGKGELLITDLRYGKPESRQVRSSLVLILNWTRCTLLDMVGSCARAERRIAMKATLVA